LAKSPGFVYGALKGLGTEGGDKRQLEIPAMIRFFPKSQPVAPLKLEGRGEREGMKDGRSNLPSFIWRCRGLFQFSVVH